MSPTRQSGDTAELASQRNTLHVQAGIGRIVRTGAVLKHGTKTAGEGCMEIETTIGPSASIQYLCVSDDHLRLGRAVSDGQGHLTIRNDQWAYCSAGRKDEPHEWDAIPATPFSALRHATLRRRSDHGQTPRPEDQADDRS
jgi:hypothetical protein